MAKNRLADTLSVDHRSLSSHDRFKPLNHCSIARFDTVLSIISLFHICKIFQHRDFFQIFPRHQKLISRHFTNNSRSSSAWYDKCIYFVSSATFAALKLHFFALLHQKCTFGWKLTAQPILRLEHSRREILIIILSVWIIEKTRPLFYFFKLPEEQI